MALVLSSSLSNSGRDEKNAEKCSGTNDSTPTNAAKSIKLSLRSSGQYVERMNGSIVRLPIYRVHPHQVHKRS